MSCTTGLLAPGGATLKASSDSVVRAFLEAGVYSLVSITVILVVVLQRARDVVLTLIPVLLSGLLTFATCAALNLPINFANIIALPLLFGVGVRALIVGGRTSMKLYVHVAPGAVALKARLEG